MTSAEKVALLKEQFVVAARCAAVKQTVKCVDEPDGDGKSGKSGERGTDSSGTKKKYRPEARNRGSVETQNIPPEPPRYWRGVNSTNEGQVG
jgi:hypothetical protein